MKKLFVVLAMVVLMMVGCALTPSRPIVKRSQEIHYDSSGKYIGRSIVQEYKNGSIVKEHYDTHGKYMGRSESK